MRKQGIPSLVIAAASMDDVLAISCFTILLGITFQQTQPDTNMVGSRHKALSTQSLVR